MPNLVVTTLLIYFREYGANDIRDIISQSRGSLVIYLLIWYEKRYKNPSVELHTHQNETFRDKVCYISYTRTTTVIFILNVFALFK